MKKMVFVLCLVFTSVAFAQNYSSGVSSISSQPQIFVPPDHPAHASYAPMSSEQSVLASSSYSSAQGERPFSDIPHPDPVPLGTAARELRKERAEVKRSHFLWVNQ
jgi:hypothetical protein